VLKSLLDKNFHEFYSLVFNSSGLDQPFTYAMAEKEWAVDFLINNPYYFFPLGFKQSRTFINNLENQNRRKSGRITKNGFEETKEISFLQAENDEWFKIDWILDEVVNGVPHCVLLTNLQGSEMLIQVPDLIRAVKEYEPNVNQKIIWTPQNPLSVTATMEVIGLETTTTELITKIKETNWIIDSIKWQDLEDILAQVYRDKGFKVIKTQRTRDGGRDLIVSGEFLPKMDLKMAVEITTQKYVDKHKVGKAILDNRDFPLIMIATTGNFSLGVRKLLESSDYQLRLKLADRDDILKWINAY